MTAEDGGLWWLIVPLKSGFMYQTFGSFFMRGRKVGVAPPRPCLFGDSRPPREPWCYLDWPFSLQVTGCRLAGGLRGRGGSVIRPDRNCRVWCSQYRCQKHQTVRRPHQVRRSSMNQRRLGVEGDSKLSPLPLAGLRWHPNCRPLESQKHGWGRGSRWGKVVRWSLTSKWSQPVFLPSEAKNNAKI